MAAPTHNDAFSDIINAMMDELHTLPHSTTIIYTLLANNIDSPVLAKIQNLSLTNLNVNQTATLLQALEKMSNLTSLALPWCQFAPDKLKFLFTQCPALSKLQSLNLTTRWFVFVW
jgi:hypothetical protein